MSAHYLNNFEPLTHLFQVESSTELTDPVTEEGENRWVYVVRPVMLQVYNDRPVPVVMSTAPFVKAWNVYEAINTSGTALGIQTADLPGTFEPKPIPDGSIVPGTYTQAEQTLVVYLWWPTQFDGDCPAEVAP